MQLNARFTGLLGGILVLLVQEATANWNANCLPKDKAVGFGHKATGGSGGKTVKPKDINELKNYLKSNQKLIIDLTWTYDFTNSEGWVTATGCYFNQCSKSGFQESLAHEGTCNGRKQTNVKYSKAGTYQNEMHVSSHKTIMSSNGKGGIKGKGLRIFQAKNVIIRDIFITDINPSVIWGGDALVLDGAQDVWIHNVHIARVGRQHLVSFSNQANRGITVSSCFFDGATSNAAYCDGMHYWVMLFWGTNDQITLINNRFYKTAGRLPHAGGCSKCKSLIHLIANDFDTNHHHGIEPKQGSYILAEGNKFTDFTAVYDKTSKKGYLALINSNSDAGKCSAFNGKCLVNKYYKTTKMNRMDQAVFNQFKKEDWGVINYARQKACL